MLIVIALTLVAVGLFVSFSRYSSKWSKQIGISLTLLGILFGISWGYLMYYQQQHTREQTQVEVQELQPLDNGDYYHEQTHNYIVKLNNRVQPLAKHNTHIVNNDLNHVITYYHDRHTTLADSEFRLLSLLTLRKDKITDRREYSVIETINPIAK